MKVRKEMIGVITTSTTIGFPVKVREDHAEMFASEGRTDIVEGIEVKVLKPKNVSKNKSSDK
jgi:hypothetical protein